MLAAVDSCFGLIGPLTREAIVPYLVAVPLPQHSYIQYSSHIPQA